MITSITELANALTGVNFWQRNALSQAILKLVQCFQVFRVFDDVTRKNQHSEPAIRSKTISNMNWLAICLANNIAAIQPSSNRDFGSF